MVSDTHGRHGKFEIAMENVGEIDALFHLGDIQGEEEYFERVCHCPVFMVAGNNDFWSDQPFSREVDLAGKKIFMTHGHGQQVHAGVEKLAVEGKKKNADIVMFGHTHMPFAEQLEGMWILNPGSLTYPRQSNHKASYMILEIVEGEIKVEVKYI